MKDKTKFMVFGYKKKIPAKGLMISSHTIERVQSFKYLGMWMDERVTWKTHAEKTVVKCGKVINVLRCLAGTDWRADRETLAMIYRAMLRSRIGYGCVVYGSAAYTTLKALDIVRAKALRICSVTF